MLGGDGPVEPHQAVARLKPWRQLRPGRFIGSEPVAQNYRMVAVPADLDCVGLFVVGGPSVKCEVLSLLHIRPLL